MFVTQGPVGPDSPLFVGREAELKQMESWLAHVWCVGSVLGARQTGKTSLLLKLRHRCRDKYSFVFVNFEGIVGAGASECYNYIAGELLEQLADVIAEMDHSLPNDNREFLSFLRSLSRKSQTVRIVVLLDEIGALPKETAFRLAHSIRAVFTDRYNKREYGRYVFILSGAVDMLELATGRTSPLKNVMESIYLRDLTEEETRLLLTRGLSQAGIYPSPTVYGQVYQWTSGHPYLTQLVGTLLVESGQPLDKATVQAVIERLLQSEDTNLPHIRRALDHGRPELWDTVKSIIGGTLVPFSRSNATVAELELIGAIRNEAGRCQIRNNLYREAIRRWLLESPHLSPERGLSPAISLQLDHLADNIRRDLALLKDYEDAQRYEADPCRQAKYRRAIEELRESATYYQREYEELQAQVSGELSIKMQDIAAQLHQMDMKLDALLIGQAAIQDDLINLQQIVLARFDTSEQTIIATALERLDQNQLATVQAMLDALEGNQMSEAEMRRVIDTVEQILVVLQQRGVVLPSQQLVAEVIAAPTLDVKHKLKVTFPIIPLIIGYEGELELGSKLNLEALWQRLVARVRGK